MPSFELRVKRYFESLGYNVFSNLNSSNVVTFIAFSCIKKWMQRPLFIKCNGGKEVNEDEERKLYEMAWKNNTVPIVVYKSRKERLVLKEIK